MPPIKLANVFEALTQSNATLVTINANNSPAVI